MNSPTKSPGWLFGLAFLVAILVRLFQLGALPLSDYEAEFALQAMNITRGLKPVLGAQPGYVLLTTPLLYIFGSTNFMARLIPALAGSLLVLLPLLFEHRLKRAAIFVAFFLALDPGLVAISRQAAGNILAITFFLFAWAYWDRTQLKQAGIFAALAMLSGPFIWAGLLAFGISAALMQFVSPKPDGAEQAHPESDRGVESNQEAKKLRNLKDAFPSFLITLFAVGTLLLFVPYGLSSVFKSLSVYINSWFAISDLTPARLLFTLIAYQPLTLVLALIALTRGWWLGQRRVMCLSIWLFVSLLLVIFNPGRQVTDLAWMVIPMLVLAGMELSRHAKFFDEERREISGVMALVLFMLAYSWLAFASLTGIPIPSEQGNSMLWLLGGALVLMLFSVVLIAAGWSIRVAKLGSLYALVIAFGIYNFSAVMAVAGLRANISHELWTSDARPAQAELLLKTVNDLSEWGRGDDHSLPVTIVGVKSPALVWLLREREVNLVDTLDITTSPELVITYQQVDPALAASYRGQDFIWNQYPNWNISLVNDWMRWLVLRKMTDTDTAIILWVRADVFIDGSHALSNP